MWVVGELLVLLLCRVKSWNEFPLPVKTKTKRKQHNDDDAGRGRADGADGAER
jgi:hypothetical protein